MSFRICEDDEDDIIYLDFNECYLDEDETTYNIVEKYKITPFELFNVLNEFGTWNKDRLEYCFDSFESAGRAIDK